MKWKNIKSAPKTEGVRFLAKNKQGDVYITEYKPDEVDGSGYGVVDSCCGYYEDMRPVKWARL
mgnify:CR=1 FL=1|tara:strand:+ start:56 stop:244 length:189 start_codon:yes stop_codon:yes gene_type:complete